ncbi:MAG: RluA family pseudouridine synthase [Lachnospiraceae bacterium]|nr:RluA family pseudouridine synthase [Lachnospiraceae bacterium]
MRQITIGPNEAGQRFDKFLHKYMKDAPSGFFYKMMRKKNIVLNGQKCTGSEKLTEGDVVKLFLSEDTLQNFGAADFVKADTSEYERAFSCIGNLQIVYEDSHILAVNKPSGILSQKAKPSDLTLNEWLIGYLLDSGAISLEELNTFKPSVCNRLDRNTSGLVLCGKSLEGTQFLTKLIRDREIRKFYRLIVKGEICSKMLLQAWLKKDHRTNQVRISETYANGADEIKTGIEPLSCSKLPSAGFVTYAEVELFTGKTHQIRAHLSSIGHPLLGDPKYGDQKLNELCRRFGVKDQLLHAYRIEFPEALPEEFSHLAGKRLEAGLPAEFQTILKRMEG